MNYFDELTAKNDAINRNLELISKAWEEEPQEIRLYLLTSVNPENLKLAGDVVKDLYILTEDIIKDLKQNNFFAAHFIDLKP